MRRLLLMAVVLLAGCTQPPIPQDHFYRVTLRGPAQGANLPAGPILVERFTADGLVAARPIVFTEGPAHVLQTYHYHYWVEPPPIMLQTALADYLRKAGAAQVVTPELKVEADITITSRIRAFEQVRGSAGGSVRVQLELAATERKGGRLLLLKVYGAEPRTSGASVGEAAQQLGAALDQIFAEFVRDFAAAR